PISGVVHVYPHGRLQLHLLQDALVSAQFLARDYFTGGGRSGGADWRCPEAGDKICPELLVAGRRNPSRLAGLASQRPLRWRPAQPLRLWTDIAEPSGVG